MSQQPIYTSNDHHAQSTPSSSFHTAYPQPMRHQHYNGLPIYPPFPSSSETSSPAPYVTHNPIAAAAAAAAAANANFARLQHRPFHEVKRRRRLTPEETRRLTFVFTQVTTKPDATMRQQLAEELNMTARAVQVWFQNRRAKVKREQDALDEGIHPSTSGSPSTPQTATPPQPDYFLIPEGHAIKQEALKANELQVIESMLNYDMMEDDEGVFTSSKEDSVYSDRDSALDLESILQEANDPKGPFKLTVCTGLKDNVLNDTTLAISLMEGETLCRNGLGIQELTSPTYSNDPYEDAFNLYNLQSSVLNESSSESSPHVNNLVPEEPSIAAMAEIMSSALNDLIIPFPGSPFTPQQDSYMASPCSMPLTPAQELDMLDLLRFPTPVHQQPQPRKVRPIAPRCNSYSNYPFTPLIPSPMSGNSRSTPQRAESRKSRSVANSPYPCTFVSPEVRQLQREQSARRYSWSVGTEQ